MDKFREFLLIVTSIITIGGIFIRVFYNFYFEIVKINKEPIQGKQPVYELGTVWCISSISIFSIMTILKDLFDKIKSFNINLIYIMAAIMLILFIFVWIAIAIIVLKIYLKVTQEYMDYLDNKSDEATIKNSHRKYKVWLWIVAIVCCVYSDLWIMAICTLDLKTILTFGIFGISSIIMFILSFNLMRAIKTIDDIKTINMLYTQKEVICCKSFLECNGYYRIFEDGVERYIKKEDVYEIRKIKNS